MVRAEEFEGNGASIQLLIDAKNWCKSYLLIDGARLFLGEETLPYIVKGLLSGVNKYEGDSAGEILGQQVKWLVSFSVAHCSIYAAENEKEVILFFQSGDARLLGQIRLTMEQCLRWGRQLTTLLENLNRAI
jgi:hypothetical protein